jgi:hypothetical protein
MEVLKRLHEHVRRVRPELWAEKNWILHHDNVSSHSALFVSFFLPKNNMITTNHPSYTPDWAPCDCFLFPKVKTIMRGEHFGDAENIKRETTRLLKNLTLQDMQHCFLQWKKRWAKCIHSGGVLWGWPRAHSRIIEIKIFGELSAQTFCPHQVSHAKTRSRDNINPNQIWSISFSN